MNDDDLEKKLRGKWRNDLNKGGRVRGGRDPAKGAPEPGVRFEYCFAKQRNQTMAIAMLAMGGGEWKIDRIENGRRSEYACYPSEAACMAEVGRLRDAGYHVREFKIG